MRAQFNAFSRKIARQVGSAYAFAAAAGLVVVWLVTGPIFDYSDTWQLIINTGTTIVTFLMVFVIQNTQNRDSKALHLKLDELICAVDKARLELVDAEEQADEVLERYQRDFERRRREGAQNGDPSIRKEAPP